MSVKTIATPGAAHLRRLSASSRLLGLTDLLTILVCFYLGGLVNFSYDNITNERHLTLVFLAAACVVIFQQLGHYDRRRHFWQEIGDIAAIVSIGFILDAALLYLGKINFSRLWVLTSWSMAFVAIPTVRYMVKEVGDRLGFWQQKTVILGTGPIAREIAGAYLRDKHLGYDVVAFVDLSGSSGQAAPFIDIGGRHVSVQRLTADAGLLPSWFGRMHVVVAFDLDELSDQAALIEKLSLHHGDIDLISPIRGLPINNARATHFFSHDVLSLRICNNVARPGARFLKRMFDILAAGALIVFTAPLMAVLAFLVRREGAPVLFAHTRVGRGGEPFSCLKFRTMVPDAEARLKDLLADSPEARAEWMASRKLKNDPRITRLGAFLRKTSLDELPQLFNVLRGDMSLVGPRPVVMDELAYYGEAEQYYFEVQPGITGLWQISGRNDLDYDRRVALDIWYVRNWTLWYDIVILFKTLTVVPARFGAY